MITKYTPISSWLDTICMICDTCFDEKLLIENNVFQCKGCKSMIMTFTDDGFGEYMAYCIVPTRADLKMMERYGAECEETPKEAQINYDRWKIATAKPETKGTLL